MPRGDLLEMVNADLRSRIAALEKQLTSLHTEKSAYTEGLQAFAYADLPSDGLGNNASYITMVFVSDGRKSGEGAGNGTGVVAYYDAAAGDWLNVADYSSVVT